MRSRINLRVFSLVALTWFASACSGEASSADEEDAGVEKFSINVEADRSRILEEEKNLQAQQQSVEAQRAELEAAQQDIADKLANLSKKDKKQRAALEAEQARLAEQATAMEDRLSRYERERKRLERQKDELLNKSTSDVNALQRRVQVQAQEINELKSSLTQTSEKLDELERIVKSLESRSMSPRTVVVERSGSTNRRASAKDVESIKRDLRRALKSKNFLVSDLSPAARRSLSDAEDAAQDKDFDQALSHYEAVVTSVKNTDVDAEFIDAKAKRADQLVRDSAIPNAKVTPILRKIGEAAADGHYVLANRHLNEIFALAKRN